MLTSFKIPKSVTHPSLPQNDTVEEQAERRAELGRVKERYLTSNINSLGLPLLKTPLPEEEHFSDLYKVMRAVATLPMIKNSAKVKPPLLETFVHFAGLADYESMYIDLPQPEVTKNWLTDESFGEQRLSGVNPGIIASVKSKQDLPNNLDLDQLAQVLDSHVNLDKLINDERLYVVDLTTYLDGIAEGKVPTIAPLPAVAKYLPKTIGLFYWEKDGAKLNNPMGKPGRLLPLAIQVDLDDSQVKIFTPHSPDLLWTIAKICFSIADANVHEMSTHLGRSHFAQEAFGAITPAQLSSQHPIFLLLKPHLRFLAVNNQAGVDLLVNEGGPVDLLLAATLEGSLTISKTAAQAWSVMQTFPQSLKARRVDSKKHLPHYPYRDDGNLIWDAIGNYVDEYIKIYYLSDQDVQDDYELQAWAATLADTGPDGGHIKDMPTQISSTSQLAQILSVIIFQNSAGHSAINFPQYPYIGFIPNMPLAGYSNHRKFLAQEGTTPQEQHKFMMDFLPPKGLASGQIDITNALSAYHFDSLGDYNNELTDPLAKHALYRFTQVLTAIEQKIEVRNRQRVVPYRYLLPSEILNSASI